MSITDSPPSPAESTTGARREPDRVLRGRLREKLPEILIEAASVVFAVLLALGVD